MNNNDKSRSWFCVWNNPHNEFSESEPDKICETVLEMWVSEKPTRTGAVAYCISVDGLIHLHMVLEDSNQARFSALKNLYPKAHLEPTKGNKEQAEDYINKRGKFTEKGEQVVYIARYGEIKGSQGSRKDLELIQDWINEGKSPNEIFAMNIRYRKYEKMVKDAFFDKRKRETPVVRDITVTWHVGGTGSGKTYTYVNLCKQYGDDEVYLISDYENGYLDMYCGEKYLFLDEFRGQIKYGVLLSMLQGYKQQFHARYSNIIGLWSEIHIASIIPPDMVYQKMVEENRDVDTIKQLYRRIDYIIYHWRDEYGYHEYKISMTEYKNIMDLENRAKKEQFKQLSLDFKTPFDE